MGSHSVTNFTEKPLSFHRYLTVEEVAEILRRSPRTIRDWITDGCPTDRGRVRLEAAKLGRSWSIREDWILVFEARVRPPLSRAALELEARDQIEGKNDDASNGAA